MSNMNHPTGSHLTLTDRILIEKGLSEDMSLSEIAKSLHKSPSTISREIKKNIISDYSRGFIQKAHPCVSVYKCDRYDVCKPTGICLIGKCANCRECYRHCAYFKPTNCYKRLHRAPYVCNGCPTKNRCHQQKYYYSAQIAYERYRKTLKEAMEGINLSLQELEHLNQTVSPLIRRGQPINHIYNSLSNDLICSKSTLYNYIDMSVLDARNLDLPRKVRLKKRSKHPRPDKAAILAARTNRTFEDFCKFQGRCGCNVVEMDTVIGCKNDSKSILTIYFRHCNYMLGFILERHTSECVCEVFDYLEEKLGSELFRTVFPCLLGDNGSEFSNPDYIEFSSNGNRRTYVFYCDPNAPYQKGALEKNHEFIRYILPKGTSFDDLKQSDLNLIINHINSIRRDSLAGHAPYDAARNFFPEKFFKSLHMKRIPDKNVTLKPELLKK